MSAAAPAATERCPCRKVSEALTYAACCGRYHRADVSGQREPAPTAEALMRSRYSAYVRENEAYLLATWHASTRPPHISFAHDQQWLSLKIVATDQHDDRATVAFVARSRIGGQADVLAETSRFVREGGRWFYLDGSVD